MTSYHDVTFRVSQFGLCARRGGCYGKGVRDGRRHAPSRNTGVVPVAGAVPLQGMGWGGGPSRRVSMGVGASRLQRPATCGRSVPSRPDPGILAYGLSLGPVGGANRVPAQRSLQLCGSPRLASPQPRVTGQQVGMRCRCRRPPGPRRPPRPRRRRPHRTRHASPASCSRPTASTLTAPTSARPARQTTRPPPATSGATSCRG